EDPSAPAPAANDTINLAAIGMGIMGFNNVRTALRVPGVKLIGACDLYQGRLTRSQEMYGKDIFTTRDYREVLSRKEVDAVVISTSDHWHDKISIAAMEAGKAVYVEKPMVHQVSEGLAVVKAEQKTGQILQVGSQRVSSIVNQKARELYAAGEIGDLVLIESWIDRQSAMGAWQYSIPTDASEDTVSWDAFIGDAPKRAFDKTRFFRWRNYQDYGTGVGGDLFVHLISAVHLILDTPGPERIFATGGLRYWEDGRDVPDVLIANFDYPKTDTHPAFNLQMRVNLIDGGGGGSMTRFIGTEGVMVLNGRSVSVKKRKMAKAPGYGGWDSYNTFSKGQQAAYKAWYEEHYGVAKKEMIGPDEIVYKAPEGYSDHYDHWAGFFHAMRTKGKVVEDASFGFRAAGPVLAANVSHFEQRIIQWDPIVMKMK
ncbi:MAG: Gfo/Idh/MocA family oxidoreductase, partial [Bacteroidota bacterium]